MKYTLIKVEDEDNEYIYKKNFLVETDMKKLEELSYLLEDCRRLNLLERVEKYNEESVIVIVENFIMNNFKVISHEEFTADCYY